jgi:hypothetical protein
MASFIGGQSQKVRQSSAKFVHGFIMSNEREEKRNIK